MSEASYSTTFAVCLLVRTAEVGLAHLVDRLGHSGPGFHDRGEARRLSPQAHARGELPVYSHSVWTFPSRLPDDSPVAEHLVHLLDRAEVSCLPHFGELAQELGEAVEAELDIAVFHMGPAATLALCPKLLQRIAQHSLGLRVSYYAVREDADGTTALA